MGDVWKSCLEERQVIVRGEGEKKFQGEVGVLGYIRVRCQSRQNWERKGEFI